MGDVLTKTFVLESKVPVNFEYQFEVLKPHPDISVHPMSGAIRGNSSSEVMVSFNASAAITAYCDVLFRLSEFNFKPQTTKIIASATHKQKATLLKTKDFQ